jgi:transcription initiation factor TFIIE subunit beta
MFVAEKLDRFKKQQEKCQSTLLRIASSKVGSRKPNTPVVAANASSNGRNSKTGVKFSNDTERLQQINNIRKAPVGAQMERVIDLLLEVILAFAFNSISLFVFLIIVSDWRFYCSDFDA